jgi:hypothetical protein
MILPYQSKMKYIFTFESLCELIAQVEKEHPEIISGTVISCNNRGTNGTTVSFYIEKRLQGFFLDAICHYGTLPEELPEWHFVQKITGDKYANN